MVSFLDAPTLTSEHVRLELLQPSHAAELSVATAGLESAWYTWVPTPATMNAEIARRLALHQEGKMVPWAIVDTATGMAVGMTTYMNIDEDNRRLEIGSTWLGVGAQGTTINPAAKLLLLGRAFEVLGCVAVEFRTHWFNRQSRAAIAKLGAKQDGVLRNHMVMANGTLRDTVVFSIIDAEWPTVKFGLQERLR